VRIVYVNKTLMDASLPAVNFTVGNVFGLARAGAEVWLLAQKRERHFSAQQLISRLGLEAPDRLHFELYHKKARWGIRTNQWFYWWALKRIKALHRLWKLDAVISRDPGALPYLARIRRRLGIAVFYQPHNFYADLSVRDDEDSRNARKYEFLERHWIPQLTGLLCLQEAQARWYRKIFPQVSAETAEPGILRLGKWEKNRWDQKTVIYVGSLQEKKGIIWLLEAFRLLENQEATLWLVGGRNRDEREAARQEVERRDLAPRVEITGWLPYPAVEDRLQKAAVAVLPLLDRFYNRYLTAPNKLFDYLAYGLPVVSSRLPAIECLVNSSDGVTFVAPGNAQALAHAIGVHLSDRARYEAASRAAFSLAKTYLWECRAGKMLQIIRKMAERDKNLR